MPSATTVRPVMAQIPSETGIVIKASGRAMIDAVMAYLSSVRWVAFCLAPWWWLLCGPQSRLPGAG
jgi:hypothetical protein